MRFTPKNVEIGAETYRKKANVKEDMVCRTTLGSTKFKLNMRVVAEQVTNPDIELDNFWYLPMINIWATDLELPIKH